MEANLTLSADSEIQVEMDVDLLKELIEEFLEEEGVDSVEELFTDNAPLHDWATQNGYTKV